MLRERNTFVLKARSNERQHVITLNVNVRKQNLSYFNDKNGKTVAKAVERLLEVLDEDEAFQSLVHEMNDIRQLDQLVKSKAKDGLHTLERPDLTIQWEVSEEHGFHSILERVEAFDENIQPGKQSTDATCKTTELTARYRPLPVRKLVVAVWMYPPQVKIPSTGERIPACNAAKHDFFLEENETPT
ncbi:hypothetical protein PsorP6_003489 [Peronosclerospora sorghi]|uniref:Uncharacterized protein n=1 Tax=Peronosclerospora sorghi TaxID=230839 RepID=A0ACC0VJB3_9STRA|nr:hypothetical protein PsorP6_003489 [Peronosclerospora sorghi]